MTAREILLGSAKHKLGVNENNTVSVNLVSDERKLPYTEDAFSVDAYEQYFKEKDESDKYRVAFTISPYCTNVLFNVLTEPVYMEGSDSVQTATGANGVINDVGLATDYKQNQLLTRKFLIQDTSYSHPKLVPDGPVVYHCGYDIFNNHLLRTIEFTPVNSGDTTVNNDFNTIKDMLRTSEGKTVTDVPLKVKEGQVNTGDTDTHLYQYDTIMGFRRAISERLIEDKGWVGFLNPATIPVENVKISDGKKIAINKCINYKGAWEQVDMYPDRTLYSFIPKINKYKNNRAEKNWDYCLTYPKESDNKHDIVSFNGVNGLRCICTVKNFDDLSELNMVMFKSQIKHNLQPGNFITMSFMGKDGDTEMRTPMPVEVMSVGNGGDDKAHYFSVRYSSIIGMINENGEDKEIRFRKYANGCEAEYYLRKFYPLPNLKNSSEEFTSYDWQTSLNRLAFSKTIFSDDVVQIVYTDDIMTAGLTDNLGRPLSEIYLTIIKRNAGYKKWYDDGEPKDKSVEFSHCFGEVTSGFDMPTDDEFRDYNVRRIHSVDDKTANEIDGMPKSPLKLESGITIENDFFYGDVAEFIPYTLTETPIEDVYHRFNTAQRETSSDNYSAFTYDEIVRDDYDLTGEFQVSSAVFIKDQRLNILPEGYYYKPHYGVRIREFSNTIEQGSHIRINYSVYMGSADGKEWTIETAKNYYFRGEQQNSSGDTIPGDTVYFYFNGKTVNGTCKSVAGVNFQTVTLRFDEDVDLLNAGKDARLYRQNPEMPEWVYELNDGTGRYLWKERLSYAEMLPENELYEEVFTNGAHYHHKNISFYLKRQDPDGEYGLSNVPSSTAGFFSVDGEKMDTNIIEQAEYSTGGDIC